MISSQAYGRSSDWWSFGVLAFDMMAGRPPFKDENKHEVSVVSVFQ